MHACIRRASSWRSASFASEGEITPRRPPAEAVAEHLRHLVEAAGAARAAAADAKQRHPAAGPKAVAGNRLVAIFGAGRDMAAGIADEAGQRQLVETDEPHAEQTGGGLAERTGIVAGGACGLFTRLVRSGRAAVILIVSLRGAELAHPGYASTTSARFASICPIASTTASKVSIVDAWRAL